MFKKLLSSAYTITSRRLATPYKPLVNNVLERYPIVANITRTFSSSLFNQHTPYKPILLNYSIPKTDIPTRTVTKYSFRKGKRKSVKAVLKRFYRLQWGGWIRTKCGRHKKLWKKSPPRKRRLRQHVMCNASQSYLLDKMVGPFWRKPRYYVDDPYEPYHVRQEFPLTSTKPRPYFPTDSNQ